MKRPLAGWLAFLVVVLGVVMTIAAVFAIDREQPLETPTSAAPAFDTTGLLGWACPEGTVTTVRCGFVQVPADYDDPEIERVGIYVGLFDRNPDADNPPLLVLGDQIGPGIVADLASWRQLGRDLDRAIILIDLRSTGRSDHQLSCVELLKTSWLEVDLGDDEAVGSVREQRRLGVDRCLERMDARATVSKLDVETLAQDLRAVREQLGVERWVVVGSGATAEVATMAESVDPEGVEALILLAAAPATDDPLSQRRDHGREALFAAFDCQRADCAGDPEFELLLKADEALGSRSVVFTTPVGGARRRVSVNQGSIVPTLSRLVGQAEVREVLPDFAEALSNRQWRQLAILRGQEFRSLEYPLLSASLALNCAYPVPDLAEPSVQPANDNPLVLADAAATDGDRDGSAVERDLPLLDDPSNWVGLIDDPLLDPGLCDLVRPIGVPLDEVPESPVLVINQAFDYRAPASAAAELAAAWPEADVVVLETGDAPDLRQPCVLGAVSEFLEGRPTLEATCQ